MRVTKKLKQLAAGLMAAIVMMSGVSLPANAAGKGREVSTLTFTVEDQKGNPLKGVELDIYAGASRMYANLKSNSKGVVRWTVEAYYDVYVGEELTIKPVNSTDVVVEPITFKLGFDGFYTNIVTINGKPADEVNDLKLIIKGTSEKPEGDTETLTINVQDEEGNPIDNCGFAVVDTQFDNPYEGQAKYPEKGMLKVQLTDSSQEQGEIRIYSQFKDEYVIQPEKITFTAKNRKFLTVNGETYDGTKEYAIVVIKKGEKPEINTEELEEAIMKAKAIKNENYTDESWKALEDAIKEAEEVLADKEVTQETVNAQIKALEDAVKGLEKNPEVKPEVDKSELEKAVADAKAIKNENYTDKSWKALEDAIKEAEEVLADKEVTQETVNAEAKALKEAIAGLTKKRKPETSKPNQDKLNKDKTNNNGIPKGNCAPKTSDTAPIIPNAIGMIFAVGVLAILKRRSVIK